MKCDHVASTNAYTYNAFGATAKTVTALSLRVNSLTISDGQSGLLCAALDVSLAFNCWAFLILRQGGVNYLQVAVNTNGAGLAQVAFQRLRLDHTYNFEVVWDSTADVWTVYIDGLEVGTGTLTGTSATTAMGAILMGSTSAYPAASTVRCGWIIIDDANLVLGAYMAPLQAYSRQRQQRQH